MYYPLIYCLIFLLFIFFLYFSFLLSISFFLILFSIGVRRKINTPQISIPKIVPSIFLCFRYLWLKRQFVDGKESGASQTCHYFQQLGLHSHEKKNNEMGLLHCLCLVYDLHKHNSENNHPPKSLFSFVNVQVHC